MDKIKIKRMLKIFFIISIIIMIVSPLFDCTSRPYLNKSLEKFFSYDISNIITILVMAWTFSVTLIIFYMGRVKQKYCGVQIYEIIKIYLPESFAFYVIILMFLELAWTLFGVAQQWEITLFSITVLQIFNLALVLYYIYLAMNEEKIIFHIQEELLNFQDICEKDLEQYFKSSWFVKFLNHLNYKQFDELEMLSHILHNENLCDKAKKAPEEKVINITQMIVECILKKCKFSVVENLICDWFMGKDCPIGVKKGILKQLIRDFPSENPYICINLLCRARNDVKSLKCWCIVNSLYLELFQGEEWRRHATKFIWNNSPSYRLDKCKDQIRTLWYSIAGIKKNDYIEEFFDEIERGA